MWIRELELVLAAPGDIFARIEELQDCVANANYGAFHDDLLVLCNDVSADLKDRSYKKAALILCGDYAELKKVSRLGTESPENIDRRRRDCVDRGLDITFDLEETYANKFGK